MEEKQPVAKGQDVAALILSNPQLDKVVADSKNMGELVEKAVPVLIGIGITMIVKAWANPPKKGGKPAGFFDFITRIFKGGK